MSTYYRHRRTEQTKVPYSFRCEQCMQESGLMLAKIAGMEVTMSSNYNVLTQAQDEKLKRKAHKNLVNGFRKYIKMLWKKKSLPLISKMNVLIAINRSPGEFPV